LVPLSDGTGTRPLLAPRVFAKLLQLADLAGPEVVLDIGTGLGYSAAVIGRVAQTVVAVEADKALADEATRRLAQHSADNVAVVVGPLAAGYAAEAPYDAIVIEGAAEEIPPGLFDQLKDGGRLVMIKIDGGIGRAVVMRRLGQSFAISEGFDAAAPVLPGFAAKPAFVF
jgi:protein-L-isoaspartate(D-aspartate) O-methyltransferase